MNSQNNQQSNRFQQGINLMNNNKLQEAKGHFTRICNDNPKDAEAWYQLSTINGRLGDIAAAGECCQRVLDIQPAHYDAQVNFGNVLYIQGKIVEATNQYQRAIKINPGNPSAYINLGNILTKSGKYDDAAACFQISIRLDPDFFPGYQNLGNMQFAQGLFENAANNYTRAVHLNPNDHQLHFNLGVTLMKLDRNMDALTCLRRVVQLKPDYRDAYINIGIILSGQAKFDEALEQYQRALAYTPTSPEVLNNIGTIYLAQGNIEKAAYYFQEALVVNPLYVTALNNLGKVCCLNGRLGLYIKYYFPAVEQLADPRSARIALIENIQNIVPRSYNLQQDEELKKCFLMENVDHQALTNFAIHHLKLKHNIQSSDKYDDSHILAIIKKITSDDLFLLCLEKTFITDADLELLLTKVRRAMLFKHFEENGINPTDLKVIGALALQGLNNEYVFGTDDIEDELVSALSMSIEQLAPKLGTVSEDLERALFVFGMYDRIYSLSCRNQLSGIAIDSWSAAIRPLLEQSLRIPIEEERIKQGIVSISSIDDKTSQLVQSQYEVNPYPRWLTIPALMKTSIMHHLKLLFPHFVAPDFLDGPLRVLVAGCGTGRHPIEAAIFYENVEITAVDISKSSLAYAIRMARKYGVKNVTFLQGDILELAKLNKKFHVIECTGVLHHMKDPIAGWKVLTGLLEKNGLMTIGLYSKLARKKIVDVREIIKEEKLASDSKSIRKLRTRILNHEFGKFIYQNSASSDFYSVSGCRDLLFHFQEHQFTIPQIDNILHDLSLEFIGFEFLSFESENNNAKDLYLAQFPEDPNMTNLLFWSQFENMRPNTFRKMYNFWCQNKE